MSLQEEYLELLKQDVIGAAQRLLGATLVYGDLRAEIVETEAYRAADDPGCHAFYGRTKRTEIMFGEPGTAYVYFTYGNHWMLNLVAHEAGNAAAILIRAARPISGLEQMASRRPKAVGEKGLLSGPGKLCAAFQINANHYGLPLLDLNQNLRIELALQPCKEVLTGPRIGLADGKGDLLPWRFADGEQLEWVSKPIRSLQRKET